MYNKVGIMGRFAQDPEPRPTPGQVPMVTFTLAVDRDFKDQSGVRGTDWIDCVAFRGTAEFICKYFKKGRMALVDGRLQVRAWQDKDGNKRRSTEVLVEDIYFADSPPAKQQPLAAVADMPDDVQLPWK